MERHPERSWGVILQQAWTMFLKDRVNTTPGFKTANPGQSQGGDNRSGIVKRLFCIKSRGVYLWGKM